MQNNLEYVYGDPELNASHGVLLPAIEAEVRRLQPSRIFDMGCGNGSVANHLSQYCPVDGVDLSESALRNAQVAYPHLRLELRSVYDDLSAEFGAYPFVLSLEVVEHLYDPRRYAANLFKLVEPGGVAMISTPYHGYIKNVVMAVTGKLDAHFTALWDGGHIKFWSIRTLSALLAEAGFGDIRFARVGRIPSLAKSMIATVRRP